MLPSGLAGRPVSVGLLALIAGTVSDMHMHLPVEQHGQPGWGGGADAAVGGRDDCRGVDWRMLARPVQLIALGQPKPEFHAAAIAGPRSRPQWLRKPQQALDKLTNPVRYRRAELGA